jgi:hypothetical protein
MEIIKGNLEEIKKISLGSQGPDTKTIRQKISLRNQGPKTKMISENPTRIHQLLPGATLTNAAQKPPLDLPSPSSSLYRPSWALLDGEPKAEIVKNIFTDTGSKRHLTRKGFSEEVLVDSSCEGVERVFKTQVRQSLPGSNERAQKSENIKVVPHDTWHYSTLNNFNNPSIPAPVIRQSIASIRMSNVMKINDPSI